VNPSQVSIISLDTSWNVSSFRRILSVRLIVVGVIVVVVPLVTQLLLITLLFSALVFYPVACISATDGIRQVTIVPAMPSPMHLWWSDAIG
jgi:hypothetical protein